MLEPTPGITPMMKPMTDTRSASHLCFQTSPKANSLLRFTSSGLTLLLTSETKTSDMPYRPTIAGINPMPSLRYGME